jgi:APA family basic amino acid/polyamine antiporter
VTAVATAASYAELSAAFPRSGGEYVYAQKSLGQKTAVFLGILLSLNGMVSGAAIALGFAGYLSSIIGAELTLASIAIIFLIFLVNSSGIRRSSALNIVFTLIEVGGLLLVIIAAFPELGKVDLLELPPDGLTGLMVGASLSFYAYIGFEDTIKLAEEARNPTRDLPRTLFIAPLIVVVLYTLIAVTAVSALPWKELADSDSPLADIMNTMFGATGAVIIAVVALFSTSNTILSNMIGSSRVILDMAKDSTAFSFLSSVSPRFHTPIAALLLVSIVMAVLTFIGDITLVALIANFFIYIAFLLVNVAVIVLRIRDPKLDRPFRIPGSVGRVPVIPIAAILMTFVLLGYNIYALTLGIQ